MLIIVINSETGAEERHEMLLGVQSLHLAEGRLLPGKATRMLRIESSGDNVLVTNLGINEPISLAGTTIAERIPYAWLPQQELTIGKFVLVWVAKPSNRPAILADAAAERFSPFITLLLLLGLAALISFFFYYMLSRNRAVQGDDNQSATSSTITETANLAQAADSAVVTPTATSDATFLPIAESAPFSIPAPSPVAIDVRDQLPTPTLDPQVAYSQTGGVAPGSVPPTPVMIFTRPAPQVWDGRLDDLSVVVTGTTVELGKPYWRLLEARWRNDEESQGMHHVFVTLRDEAGNPVYRPYRLRMFWPGDGCNNPIEDRGEFERDGGNCPMYAAGYAYSVRIDGDLPSELVLRLGLGYPDNRTLPSLTSFEFIFQKTISTP